MSEAQTSQRPNIIFYLTEKQRADTCGCFGQKLATTPVLDELAQQGVKFNQAFATLAAPVAMKATLLTGQDLTKTKCFKNLSKLPKDTKTLASFAQEQGYETAFIGSWQLGTDSKSNLDKSVALNDRGGFSQFWRGAHDLKATSSLTKGGFVYDEQGNKVEFAGYRSDCLTDMALEFLDKRDSSKPFFMTMCYSEPTAKTQEQIKKEKAEADIKIKEKVDEIIKEQNITSIPKMEELRYQVNFDYLNNLLAYDSPSEEVEELFAKTSSALDIQVLTSNQRRNFQVYLAQCYKIDQNLGKLVAKLKEQGLYDNTVIVFTSLSANNFGCRNNDKNFNGFDDGARSAHDNSSHVPLVIGGGYIKSAKSIDELVSLESLAKTAAKLMSNHCSCTDALLGEDLLALDPNNTNEDKELYYQISESRVGRALRTSKYLFAVNAPKLNGTEAYSATAYVDDYMYDIKNDDIEINSLVYALNYKEIREQLRTRLIELIQEREQSTVTIEPRVRAKIENDNDVSEGYREGELDEDY